MTTPATPATRTKEPTLNAAAIAAALHAHARGIYPSEAAVALVIHHQYWLTRADFLTGFTDIFPGFTDGTPMAAVCWPEAVAALDRGQLSGSGSENRILRLAASLADGIPVDLHSAVSGLDDTNLQHVVTAIQHAAGRRPDQDHRL
jgi:hypothetical protein